MYTVYCDGALLFAPDVPELKIFQPTLKLEAGKAGQFDFTVYPAHPLYAQIKRLTSVVEVYQEDLTQNGNGGKNLLKNSHVEKTGTREYIQYADLTPIFDEYGMGIYTFSFDLKSEKAGLMKAYTADRVDTDRKYDFPVKVLHVTTEYKRYSMTVEVTKPENCTGNVTSLAFYGSYDSGRVPSVKNVKVEKGDKATPWTPAPEDGATGRKVRLFRGRVLNDKTGFRNERAISCEGELGYLNDSVYRPYNFGGPIEELLQSILDSHNAQVEESKRFVLGDVTVTDPNDYIVRSSINADKTWKVLEEKFTKMLGGYFVVRREGNVNYLDYLLDSAYRSQQEITLGKNLIDLKKDIKGEDIITALIPYGAKLTDAEGNEVDARVTIEPVNDGVDYIYNQDAVDAYGWIFDTVLYDDITLPQNLLTRANKELGERILTNMALTLSAVDLSMTDDEIDRLRVFEYVKVNSPVHQLNDFMLITKLDIDLFNPQNNTISLGTEYKSFIDDQRQTDSAIKNIDTMTPGEIRQTVSDAITEVTTTLQSSFEQTADAFRQEVATNYSTKSELEDYRNEVNTQFEQTSDTFNFNFETLTERIRTVDGETRTEFEDLKRYIRLQGGSITLGEVGNPFILEIRNDRICFLQNGAEVAYLSNDEDTQKIYINDGQIVRSLQIGNFAFIPRENGNLSFTKVV